MWPLIHHLVDSVAKNTRLLSGRSWVQTPCRTTKKQKIMFAMHALLNVSLCSDDKLLALSPPPQLRKTWRRERNQRTYCRVAIVPSVERYPIITHLRAEWRLCGRQVRQWVHHKSASLGMERLAMVVMMMWPLVQYLHIYCITGITSNTSRRNLLTEVTKYEFQREEVLESS